MRRRPLPPPRAPRWNVCHSSPRVVALGLAVFAVVYAAAPASVDGSAAPGVAWLLDDDVGAHWVEVYVTVDGAEVPFEGVRAQVAGEEGVELTHRAWGSWAASHAVPAGSDVRFEGIRHDGAVLQSPTFEWPG